MAFSPSAGLRKKEDLLLGGGDACLGRKEPRVGLAGSRPLVSGGSVWLSRPEGRRLAPPTVSSLLLSNTIMRGPCPQFSYLQKINGRGRSLVCLQRFAIVLLDGVQRLNLVAPIWILSDQVWAPPAGKQLHLKIKAQRSPGSLGAPQPWWPPRKTNSARAGPTRFWCILLLPLLAWHRQQRNDRSVV